MKVLLVDDSKTMRIIQKKAFACLGDVAFYEAGDGIEALKTFKSVDNGFDFALIDWNMPNMNGLELLKQIRAFDPQTPLIMVTTEAEKENIVAALRAGATGYILKPFTPENLRTKVQESIARRQKAA